MTISDAYENPEPVPAASQLALLPFLSAVSGYLREDGDVEGLRITVHRVMSREKDEYLQQACAYLQNSTGVWRGKVGRTFAVDTGIMGAAYDNGKVWRTKRFGSDSELRAALELDGVDPNSVGKSWLAVPFLGPDRQVVLILFAECSALNFFAEDTRIKRLVAMSKGYCELLDWLQKEPFERLRNFPLQKGKPVTGAGGVYSFQEVLEIKPPAFSALYSFNYESSAA